MRHEKGRAEGAEGLSPEELISWEELRSAVEGQVTVVPPPQVERQLLARVRVREARELLPPPSWSSWALGVITALLTMILLWATLKPGIILHWSLEDEQVSALRLTRTSLGKSQVEELARLPAHHVTRYVDVRVWPDATYVYRLEALSEEGQLLATEEITVHALSALPAQLAVLFTGLVVGYGIITLLQMRRLR